jgi:hypothetical protein
MIGGKRGVHQNKPFSHSGTKIVRTLNSRIMTAGGGGALGTVLTSKFRYPRGASLAMNGKCRGQGSRATPLPLRERVARRSQAG